MGYRDLKSVCLSFLTKSQNFNHFHKNPYENPSLLSPNGGCYVYRSEGFALTGYVVPGCVEDGTWMLWENSSVVVAVAVTVLARYFLDNFSKKSLFLVISHEKLTFGDIYFFGRSFVKNEFPPKARTPVV